MVQAIAQYVAAREAQAAAAREVAVEQRAGDGGVSVDATRLWNPAPGRVPSDPLEATGYRWDDDDDGETPYTSVLALARRLGNSANGVNGGNARSGPAPLRLDDFGARLHGLEGADLDYLWMFVKAGGSLRTSTRPTLCTDEPSPRVVSKYEHSP